MNAMKTTYSNFPLLQKGYPTPFWIASAGSASNVTDFSTAQLLNCSRDKAKPSSWVSFGLHTQLDIIKSNMAKPAFESPGGRQCTAGIRSIPSKTASFYGCADVLFYE